MAELATRIVIRNDSFSNWESVKDTAILLKGEMGIEFLADGTPKIKVGDGVSTWEQLKYCGAEGAKTFHVNSLEEITDTELSVGDIAIVKTVIYEDADNEANNKYSYTGYVYNGESWEAMDGNYSAANVFLNEDVTVTTKTGELSVDTVVSAGTSVQDMLVQMLSQSKDPTKTNPSISSFSVTNNGSGDTFEAGTTVTPVWNSTFSAGSYTYKSTVSKESIVPVTGTGVTATGWTITQDGTAIGTTEDGTGTAFVLGDSNVTFNAKATYSDGNYALTNLNKLPETDVQITAGTTAEKSDTIYTYRKMFAGGVTDSAAEITSDVIRGLSTGVKVTTSATEFTAKVGDTKLIFAYPSTLSTAEPTFEYFTMSWESFAGFVEAAATVQVADVRGGENGLKEYTVYTYTPAGAFESDTKFRVSF